MRRRNLRSTVTLSDSIQTYLLENSSTGSEMADGAVSNGPEETNTSERSDAMNEMQAMVSSLSGDPTKLCELLVKNLTMANESNKQMQKLLENRSEGPKYSVSKLDNCPIKGKYSSLEAWLQEVELWNDTNKSEKEEDNINAKKYLKFMDSVKDSEDCEELKKLVQVEFKENQAFDKKSKSINDAIF